MVIFVLSSLVLKLILRGGHRGWLSPLIMELLPSEIGQDEFHIIGLTPMLIVRDWYRGMYVA